MTELRNVEQELSRFRARVLVASAVMLVCFLLLVARLVWLQVGIRDEATARRLEAAGIAVVMDRCLAVDHQLQGD